LVQQNGYGPTFLHNLLKLIKGTIVIGPSVLVSLVSHLFAITILVVWEGLEKKYIIKLGCEK
jgi:hypothetical protein